MVEQNSEITIETLPNGSDTAHIEPGFLIDEKYKVLEPIGSGGMGTIYRVEQVFLGKEFALKLLNSNRLTDRETRRFHLEAKMTAQLQHPNLVDSHRKSISFRKWNGVMYILGGAMLGALVIFGINSWSETGQLKTPAKRSVQGNTTQNRPDKIYPYAEVFMDSDGNPIRRFHFDDCPDLGFISWQGRTFKTNRTVEIRSLEPVAFTLVDQSMASDRNLLSKFSGIEFNSLDLSDNKHVDSDTIQPLFRFTNLETINLNHTSVSSIKSLSRLPKLKDLWVLGTNVSTEGILNVSRLLELESLRFGPVENPTRIITRLQGSNNLVSLHIKGPGIDAGSVSQIAKLRNLKELELRDCPEIKDSALSGLTRCIKLQTLIIRDCAITAKSMETFKRILPLRKLSITADGWSDKERAHLIKAFPYASIVISKGGKRIKRENALQHFLEIE